ncbi:MAG TPA: beta-galactosidase [Chloroflexia bacterium]|nr:beta-galactosidase [Chloroflexia bacterium]
MPRLTTAAGTLLLDGQPWFLRAAEFHYFRIARALWEPGLARLAALGFNAISTYVPWIWHEPAPGAYDFRGTSDPRRDLDGFLAACRAAGLPVILRPGPFIYAEYEGFGVPRWLEAQIPEAQMRGPRGAPVAGDFWTAWSLGHPAYRAAVARWIAAVATTCAGGWDDPIIAWQLDNETGSIYANGQGKWDWNPDTVARFHRWLAAEYGTLAGLNAAWGSRYSALDAVRPPRVPFRRGLLQDYQRFLEGWIDDYLVWLRGVTLDAGVPVPLSHNDSANFIPPINPGRKIATGSADLPGYDVYVKMTSQPTPTDYPWGSACAPAYFRAVTPPVKPLLCWELGAGWFDPRARAGDAALVNNLLGNLAQGMGGFALYIAHDCVEADGHVYRYGTVLDEHGEPGPRHEVVARMLAFLQAHETDLLASAPPGPPRDGSGTGPVLGFAFHYPDFRFTPEDFLPGVPLQEPARLLALVMGAFGLYAALLAAGYGPSLRLIDLYTATPAELAACTAVVLPSKGALTLQTLTLLEGYVEGGGHLITCGRTPRRLLTGAPLDTRRLYPAPVQRTRFFGTVPALAYLARHWLARYPLVERGRIRQAHPTSLHTSDVAEPVFTLFYAPQRARTLQPAPGRWGDPVRGDYLLQTYRLRPGAVRALLRTGRAVASYTTRRGQGSGTMVGSLPGGSYFTPQYYRLTPAERAGVRAFWRARLGPLGLHATFTTDGDSEIEVTHRPFPGGGFLFLINRQAVAQAGTVQWTAAAGIRGPLVPVFAGGASHAAAAPEGLAFTLAAGDCVVLRWSRPA